MHRTDSPLIAVAIALAALAGFVDALAFTSLGGFFASFMSGNSTRLGVGAAGAAGDLPVAGALVLSFVSGVILATVIARAMPARGKPAVMAAVAALLALAGAMASLSPGTIVLLLLATAMGAAHTVSIGVAEASVGAVGLTGLLVAMGRRLAGALMGDADRWGWVPALLLWMGFVAGVVLGASAHIGLGATAYWLAAIAGAGLTVWLDAMRGKAA